MEATVRYAMFITTMAINDNIPFDIDESVLTDVDLSDDGIYAKGLTDDEIVDAAMDDFSELYANEGPNTPFFVTEDQLVAIEALLPEKPR